MIRDHCREQSDEQIDGVTSNHRTGLQVAGALRTGEGSRLDV
jgi:hypothetical protein